MTWQLGQQRVLLHVGPYKTGTAALQNSLQVNRSSLRAHGITYPGKGHNHNRAAMSALRAPLGWGDHTPRDRNRWERFAQRVKNTPGRVVVSSEVLCTATSSNIDRIVQELGRDRVSVAITLRPLESLLGSTWQQLKKSGDVSSFPEWLEEVVRERDGRRLFWRRNDHPALITRWAEVIGWDQVVVVVADRSRPELLFDSFESILGLPNGLLQDAPRTRTNRSLTREEAAVLQELNQRVRGVADRSDYMELIKRGLAMRIVEGRTPTPAEQAIQPSRKIVEAIREYSRADVVTISRLPVAIYGNLADLAPMGPAGSDEPLNVEQVPVGVAADFLEVMLDLALESRKQPTH